jgi:ribosomal subunit interface protein
MQRPLQITARDFSLSPAIEKEIRDKAASLEQYYDRISGCEIVVEGAVGHHRHGGPFRVRIRLTLPRGEVEANRQAKDDLAVAVREAFDAVRRRLEDHVRGLRGQVKTHEESGRARVAKLFPEQDYGFLATAAGDEVYFNRNSVLAPGFDRLRVGSAVRFVEEMGDNGPQASTVSIVRPRRAGR